MPSFSFILTEKCNWNCPYCYFTGLAWPKEPNLDRFKEHLPYIKKIIDKLGDLVVNIDIQGGEVGLISEDILEYFFETIDKPIVVSTNGMFMERGYHLNPKIRKNIDSIMYHLHDFSYPTELKDDYYQDGIPFLRGIVHDNIDEIVDFIKSHPLTMFDYIEFEFDIKQPRVMDPKMYGELYGRIKDLKNVSEKALWLLSSREFEYNRHRDNCKNYNHSILIDLVNANICLCQRQLDISIPLTEESLIYRLKNFPMDVFDGNHCESCTRLYFGKYSGNVIERALLTRSRI